MKVTRGELKQIINEELQLQLHENWLKNVAKSIGNMLQKVTDGKKGNMLVGDVLRQKLGIEPDTGAGQELRKCMLQADRPLSDLSREMGKKIRDKPEEVGLGPALKDLGGDAVDIATSMPGHFAAAGKAYAGIFKCLMSSPEVAKKSKFGFGPDDMTDVSGVTTEQIIKEAADPWTGRAAQPAVGPFGTRMSAGSQERVDTDLLAAGDHEHSHKIIWDGFVHDLSPKSRQQIKKMEDAAEVTLGRHSKEFFMDVPPVYAFLLRVVGKKPWELPLQITGDRQRRPSLKKYYDEFARVFRGESEPMGAGDESEPRGAGADTQPSAQTQWDPKLGAQPAKKDGESDEEYAARLKRAAWSAKSRLREIIAEELKSILEGK